MASKRPTNPKHRRAQPKSLNELATADLDFAIAHVEFNERLKRQPIREWFQEIADEAIATLDEEQLGQAALWMYFRVQATKCYGSVEQLHQRNLAELHPHQ